MTRSTTELGPCQVRKETNHPCPRPAAVEIWGVPFCEQHAREQEAYFAIGELTQEHARHNEPLVGVLDRMRWRLFRRSATEEGKHLEVVKQ